MAENNLPILVGVDGSEPSIAALREAVKLAEATHAPLRVVTVWEYPALVPYVASEEREQEAAAASVLSFSVDRALGEDETVEPTRAILEGSPAPRLIEESRHACMLVLGTRGAGGFARLLLGSVSAACAAHAHCPVLLVRDSVSESYGRDSHR
jgi:nucleotide-binding universal stress UspA family protein